MAGKPRVAYESLAAVVKSQDDLKGDAVASSILDTVAISLRVLKSRARVDLECDVPDKGYFCFTQGPAKSRPVNNALFDPALASELASRILKAKTERIGREDLQKALYTMAMAYCVCADLASKGGDKKTPGTFFEYLVGHLVARVFGVNPSTAIEVQSLDIKGSLPTDFTFDLGAGRNKIHMPIKTSTRERVIQVWAHQRVIDGVFGVGRFKGVLVCLSETNSKPGFAMTEVCLPGQWTIYQMFIAQLHRVYYLDVPAKYAELASAYPFIQVKPFAEFFFESEKLAQAAPFS